MWITFHSSHSIDSTHKLSKPNISQITNNNECNQLAAPDSMRSDKASKRTPSQSTNVMNDIERDANVRPIANPLSKSTSLNHFYQYAKAPRSATHIQSPYNTQTNAKHMTDSMQNHSNVSHLPTAASQKL